MGRIFTEFVDEETAKYICRRCRCDIAGEQSLLWEGFMGASTPAFLFHHAVNLDPCRARRTEVLSTGRYTLTDVRCRSCRSCLGWKYLAAERCDDNGPEQKYKEGTVLLQQGALHRINNVQALASRSAAAAEPSQQA